MDLKHFAVFLNSCGCGILSGRLDVRRRQTGGRESTIHSFSHVHSLFYEGMFSKFIGLGTS